LLKEKMHAKKRPLYLTQRFVACVQITNIIYFDVADPSFICDKR